MDHVQGNLSRFTMGPLYLLHTFSYIVHNTVGYIVQCTYRYNLRCTVINFFTQYSWLYCTV